jgi:hypothetical protein
MPLLEACTRSMTWLNGKRQRGLCVVGRGWAGLLAALLAMPAAAAPPDNLSPLKSRFTTVEIETCEMVKKHPDGDARRCDGLADWPIYVAEGDQRTFVSFGAKADQTRAATQTLGPFNSLYVGRSRRVTVEWRYVRRGGKDLPYAAIVRYVTARDGARGQVLVVTRIGPDGVCHMGYIDALANPSAIALARSLADEKARSFDCKSGPQVYGATGKSPL